MTKDQEIASLSHKISTLESDLEKAEQAITEGKSAKDDGETHRSVNENLNRKIALLEGELDAAEKSLRETTDKYVVSFPPGIRIQNVPLMIEIHFWFAGFDKLTSRRNTLNVKLLESSQSVIHGRRNTKKRKRSTTPQRENWTR